MSDDSTWQFSSFEILNTCSPHFHKISPDSKQRNCEFESRAAPKVMGSDKTCKHLPNVSLPMFSHSLGLHYLSDGTKVNVKNELS